LSVLAFLTDAIFMLVWQIKDDFGRFLDTVWQNIKLLSGNSSLEFKITFSFAVSDFQQGY